MDTFFVYVLVSTQTARRYVGMSENPERRLQEHNLGKTRSTKAFRPWVLIYTEAFKTLREARGREVFLKSGHGRAYLDRKLGHPSENNLRSEG